MQNAGRLELTARSTGPNETKQALLLVLQKVVEAGEGLVGC